MVKQIMEEKLHQELLKTSLLAQEFLDIVTLCVVGGSEVVLGQ